MMNIIRKPRKKTVKGMTLIEIIIAIAVLAIMAAMAGRIGSLSAKLMIATNHLNNKTEVEAPAAAVRDVAEATQTRTDNRTDPLHNGTSVTGTVTNNVGIKITSSDFAATYNMTATKYDTSAIAKEKGDTCDTSDHTNSDLQFYVIN